MSYERWGAAKWVMIKKNEAQENSSGSSSTSSGGFFLGNCSQPTGFGGIQQDGLWQNLFGGTRSLPCREQLHNEEAKVEREWGL